MTHPTDPTPLVPRSDTDSLATDIVIADDQGGMMILPADPVALAQWLEGCRQALRARAAKKKERESGDGNPPSQ
jgi:hypothetical protein